MNRIAPSFKPVSSLYMVLSVVFTTCLLLANITAFKLMSIGSWAATSAILLFPVTYIINDVMAEVYGYKKARFTIIMGFSMNLLMVLFFAVTIALPYPAFFSGQEAYRTVLSGTPRLLIASLTAYLFGSTINAKVLVWMKSKAKSGEGLFARCAFSTLVGELVDSLIFISIAFFAVMPNGVILNMILTQAAFKIAYEVIIFPVTKVVIKKVKLAEGVN